jgi:hypothetical protein
VKDEKKRNGGSRKRWRGRNIARQAGRQNERKECSEKIWKERGREGPVVDTDTPLASASKKELIPV